MTRRISSLMILSLILLAFMATTAFAARTVEETKTKTFDPLLNKSKLYAFPDANRQGAQVSDKAMAPVALGGAIPSASPGEDLGDTWYDYQHNGSVGRMIDWGTHGSPDTMIVHFAWMYLPGPSHVDRAYYYKAWNAVAGVYPGEVAIITYGGYVNVQAANDNRAVYGGHVRATDPDPSFNWFYWDWAPGNAFFSFHTEIPDTIDFYCQGEDPVTESGHIWPKFAYVEGPGENDTVLHVFAQKSEPGAGDPQSIAYFRRVGSDKTYGPTAIEAGWDPVPYCVDTVYDIAQEVVAQGNKVALVWIANLPCPGDCDTCSGYECWNFVQWDNDIYYQISLDYGVNWQPRVNVTKNQDGVDGYRPYTDLTCMFDTGGNLHIVWPARFWPADANSGGQAGLFRGRMFHVSDADTTDIRTVHNYEWDQTTCSPAAWNLNASKPTISECNGKFYVLFTQANDIPAGIEDDCAIDGNPGFPYGAANGDLYIVVSEDGGKLWDKARNITNSRTPGCDSALGIGGPCDNDHWPSMAKFGTDYTGDFPTSATITVPNGSGHDGYYIDAQYINDHSAGGIVQDEGFWQVADVRWIRIPCVDPIREAILYLNPTEIDYPSWSKHGVEYSTTVVAEAGGNDSIFIDISKDEGTGPTGWLSYSPTRAAIEMAPGETTPVTVTINPGGAIVNDPGTIVHLSGKLIFHWWGATAPVEPPGVDTDFPIDHWVTDTLYAPIWDTISTACTKLSVANTGNFGQQGIGKVNMDYVDAGDCDTTADVYLYDGSPVVCYEHDGDMKCNWSIFSTTYVDSNGFVPVGDHTPVTNMGDYYVFESGKFVTNDSLIAIEKIWYAPKDNIDSCSFVIECIKIYLNDTLKDPPTAVLLGEAIDWDIPADSNSRNNSGFNDGLNLIYQRGSEEDSVGCQPCSTRWGGMDFLDGYKNGTRYKTAQHGAYTHDNSTHVYPLGGFSEDTLNLYMANPGFAISDSTNSDLHMAMTFDSLVTLTKADTFVFYIEVVSHWNGDLNSFLAEVEASRQWYFDHISPEPAGCCQNRGNVDHLIGPAGPVDVADLTYLVAYLFQGGNPPPCEEEGNVDALIGPAGPIDVADLTYLVAYLFQGGNPPPPC